MQCWTIGHSTLSSEAFLERLDRHGIEQVADIRRYPASQRHPQFNREMLQATLEARNKRYRWFEALGGRREGLAPEASPNRGIEDEALRHYADYTATPPFAEGYAGLRHWIARGPTALMCAEADWRHCHRRLVSDRLVADGVDVDHIVDDERSEAHSIWHLASPGDRLVYPPVQKELEL